MIEMVLKSDIRDLPRLLKVYELSGQRGITKEQDKLLTDYKSSMPHGWDWRKEDVDPLVRHRIVGIFHD